MRFTVGFDSLPSATTALSPCLHWIAGSGFVSCSDIAQNPKKRSVIGAPIFAKWFRKRFWRLLILSPHVMTKERKRRRVSPSVLPTAPPIQITIRRISGTEVLCVPAVSLELTVLDVRRLLVRSLGKHVAGDSLLYQTSVVEDGVQIHTLVGPSPAAQVDLVLVSCGALFSRIHGIDCVALPKCSKFVLELYFEELTGSTKNHGAGSHYGHFITNVFPLSKMEAQSHAQGTQQQCTRRSGFSQRPVLGRLYSTSWECFAVYGPARANDSYICQYGKIPSEDICWRVLDKGASHAYSNQNSMPAFSWDDFSRSSLFANAQEKKGMWLAWPSQNVNSTPLSLEHALPKLSFTP